MKANEIYKDMINKAKEIEDKEHTRLYVSDTVSKYLRNEVKKLVRKNLENTLIDKELRVIDEETAKNEIEIARLVYKSL